MNLPTVDKVRDSSSNAHTSEPQRSANPDTPPPEYSVLVPEWQQGTRSSQPSQHSLEQSSPNSSSGPQLDAPSLFGPTPLVQSQPTLGLLPYYDPNSPHSLEGATLRAKRRFITAAFWAFGGLIACLSMFGALRGVCTAF